MHWNINTATESDRLAEIGAVIRTHAPALVGLNEVALGPAAFARQAKAWGFAHSLLLKTDGAHRFNLGLMATTTTSPGLYLSLLGVARKHAD